MSIDKKKASERKPSLKRFIGTLKAKSFLAPDLDAGPSAYHHIKASNLFWGLRGELTTELSVD